MLRCCGLALVLTACATKSSEPSAPVVEAPPRDVPEEPAVAPLKLSFTQPLKLGSGVTLRAEHLVIEEIAADPSGSYPAGSGITLAIVVEWPGSAPIRREFSLLSSGYASQQVGWFGPYRVEVADVQDAHRREATVLLRLSKVTDVATTVPQVVTLIKQQGAVALGDATVALVGLMRAGRTVEAPLYLDTEYRVPGQATEMQRDTIFGAAKGWRWRDYRFTLLEEEAESVKIEVVRVRMAPQVD